MTFESAQPVESIPAAPAAARGVRFNNISHLRLLFAASVMVSHALLLLDPNSYRLIRIVLNSEAAVQGFFILSGMLVFGSFARIASASSFWRRRLARLYPGYAVAVLVFAGLVLAQAMLQGVAVEWDTVPRYLAANLATLNFLQPTIGGVFEDSHQPAINGALWSIKVELMFYAFVPLLFAIGRRVGFGLLAAALIAAGVLYWPVLLWLGEQAGVGIPVSFKFQLPGQVHYFALGVGLFAVTEGRIDMRAMALLVGLMIALLALVGQSREALQAAVLVAIIGGVSRLPAVAEPFGGRDLSYGIYLAHFPLIHILLAAGAAAVLPVGAFVALVVVLAGLYALASWHLIEKPALALGKPRRKLAAVKERVA